MLLAFLPVGWIASNTSPRPQKHDTSHLSDIHPVWHAHRFCAITSWGELWTGNPWAGSIPRHPRRAATAPLCVVRHDRSPSGQRHSGFDCQSDVSPTSVRRSVICVSWQRRAATSFRLDMCLTWLSSLWRKISAAACSVQKKGDLLSNDRKFHKFLFLLTAS